MAATVCVLSSESLLPLYPWLVHQEDTITFCSCDNRALTHPHLSMCVFVGPFPSHLLPSLSFWSPHPVLECLRWSSLADNNNVLQLTVSLQHSFTHPLKSHNHPLAYRLLCPFPQSPFLAELIIECICELCIYIFAASAFSALLSPTPSLSSPCALEMEHRRMYCSILIKDLHVINIISNLDC